MNENEFQASINCSERISSIASELIIWRKPMPITHPKARFPGFNQRKVHFKAGQVVKKGYMPLPADMIMHESVPMKLSDSVTLYSDIFLPAQFEQLDQNREEAERVPAIIACLSGHRTANKAELSFCPIFLSTAASYHRPSRPFRSGKAPTRHFWCSHDYAIVNVDIRGTYTSEGDAAVGGHREASDGAEFVTWLSNQPWCNGKVALSGNSWLAVCQWKIASLRPAGLAAIAPWEGLEDFYSDVICRGGIPDTGFVQAITSAFAGKGQLEDMVAGLERSNDLRDAYWEDKRAVVERINIPVYAVACWTSLAHTSGTLRAWKRVPDTTPKVIRIHNTMEWPDYYEQRNVLDLKRFFDYYLKGVETNWLATPKVRLSVLNLGMGLQQDVVDRAETEWPLARTKYVKHYLSPDKSLSLSPPASSSETTYDSKSGSAVFDYPVPHDFEMTGYPRAHLYVSCPDHSEIDIFVQIEKFTPGPRPRRLGTLVIRPKTGPWAWLLKLMHDWEIGTTKLGLLYSWGSDGRLRASHAGYRIRETEFDEIEPRYRYEKRTALEPGEIRCLDVPMRPYGLSWEKGDVLRFTIKGEAVIPFAIPGTREPTVDNKGVHIVHCGGRERDSSCLILPVI